MKFIHLSDLHLGKRVNEFSMIEDQEFILNRIFHIVEEEQPEAVVIAGDVYDKPVPGAQAVTLLDAFLNSLAARRIPVLLISGNHDSPERIAFGAELMEKSGMYVSGIYKGAVSPVSFEDRYGSVCFYLLPFLKPATVRPFFPDREITTYMEAVESAISQMEIDYSKRNVLVAHQFVTGAIRCDSEEVSVGGLDHVDASVFDGFDYVALGHIHGPQKIGTDRIRYAGSPLKYSFSEVHHHKSVTVVELKKKGKLSVRMVPLCPKRDMLELKGTYEELTDRGNYEAWDTDAFLRIILTDEEEEPDAFAKLQIIYPNLMRLEYDNWRTRVADGSRELTEDVDSQLTPLEMFSNFYEMQNNQPVTDRQRQYLYGAIQKIWEE